MLYHVLVLPVRLVETFSVTKLEQNVIKYKLAASQSNFTYPSASLLNDNRKAVMSLYSVRFWQVASIDYDGIMICITRGLCVEMLKRDHSSFHGQFGIFYPA